MHYRVTLDYTPHSWRCTAEDVRKWTGGLSTKPEKTAERLNAWALYGGNRHAVKKAYGSSPEGTAICAAAYSHRRHIPAELRGKWWDRKLAAAVKDVTPIDREQPSRLTRPTALDLVIRVLREDVYPALADAVAVRAVNEELEQALDAARAALTAMTAERDALLADLDVQTAPALQLIGSSALDELRQVVGG